MPTAGPGRNAALVVDVPVRDQPIGVERAPLRGRAHAAIRLGQMAAIVEAALVEEAAELRKTGGEQLRVDAPGPDLPQARRVHHVGAPPTPPTPPTRGEGYELRRPRRVLPRPPLLVDLADPEIQARLERVHETRLPHPRFSGQDGGTAPQQVAQRGETLGRLDRRREHLIAGRAVAAAEQLERAP